MPALSEKKSEELVKAKTNGESVSALARLYNVS